MRPLTDEHILSFEAALNSRPRRLLGYQTAEEQLKPTHKGEKSKD